MDFIPSLTAEDIYSYDFKIWNWNGKEAEVKDLLYSFTEDELEKMLSLELKDAETEGLYFFEFAGSFFDDVEEALKDRDLELLACLIVLPLICGRTSIPNTLKRLAY